MKKILITGSNGLLGQKLTDLLLTATHYEFIATGLGENRHPNKNITYDQLDITDEVSVNEVLAKHRPHFVINTAAMTNVDACETEKALCDKLNIDAVLYLSKACEKLGAKMVHISTDFIFDGKNGPYKEEDEAKPLSYYGLSKLKGEEIVIKNCSNYAILRTVLVYGVVNDMSRSNIVLWAKEALTQKKAINVVNDQFRTPTLAEDLAMGCKLVCDKAANGIFNISGSDFMNIYELVERVAKFFDLSMENVSQSDSANLNQAAKRPPITGFVLDKAKEMLNYQPHTFEEGLALVKKQLMAVAEQ